MKRRFSSIAHLLVTAVAAVVLSAGHASAQSKTTIYIPFAFTANHQTLPAGHYTLELLSDRFLCFSDSKTAKHIAAVMVQPEQGEYIETRGRLRFLISNDRHYLTEIRFAGSSMHSKTVVRRSFEREVAGNQSEGSSIEVAMAK